MAYLIGTDEAGYGPNLGPLVIGGTLWRVPEGVDGEQLYERLPGVISPGSRSQRQAKESLPIGDSKSLFSPGGGLAALERGVYAALYAGMPHRSAAVPSTWRELFRCIDGNCATRLDEIPWYATFDRPVPVDAATQDVIGAQQTLSNALKDGGVELVAVNAKLLFPADFNARVQQCGSKGSALSLWTLELVSQMLEPFADGPILIQCDKHGGRNRYAGLIQHVFPEHLVRVREESRQRSVYEWGPASRRMEAQFIAKGERFLPSALASMTAKYLRELAMQAFNSFWQQHIPELRATAGYPVDAKRFRSEIQATQRQLGISDHVLWREK